MKPSQPTEGVQAPPGRSALKSIGEAPPSKAARLRADKEMELDGAVLSGAEGKAKDVEVTYAEEDAGQLPPDIPVMGNFGFIAASSFNPPSVAGSRPSEFPETVPATIQNADDEEPTMRDLMKALNRMESSLGRRIDVLSDSLVSLRAGLVQMKEDMVTKTVFAKLEERVAALEKTGVQNIQNVWLQQQMSCLDPANKSLFFTGIVQNNAKTRADILRQIIKDTGEGSQITNIEDLWTGLPGKRVITSNVIMEFSFRSVSESVLAKLAKEDSPMKSAGKITCSRAKTSVQLKRNGSLKQVCNVLKKDSRCKDKTVTIIWQIEGSNDRSVEVDGHPIFHQKLSDLTGIFDSQFQDSSF